MQTTKPSPDVFAFKPKDSAFDNSDKSSFFLKYGSENHNNNIDEARY